MCRLNFVIRLKNKRKLFFLTYISLTTSNNVLEKITFTSPNLLINLIHKLIHLALIFLKNKQFKKTFPFIIMTIINK